MKYLLKKILPSRVIKTLRIRKIKKIISYYINKQYKYCYGLNPTKSKEQLLSEIIVAYHPLEKGLTMCDVKPGFGEKKVIRLLNLCDKYIKQNFDLSEEMFLECVAVLYEYSEFHQKINYSLNSNIVNRINKLIDLTNIKSASKQLSFSYNSFFENVNASFDKFSNSRHSIRDFDDKKEFPVAKVQKAIELAQNAPSTCNRQSVRIYTVKDKVLLNQILKLQDGNTGFGNKLSGLLIISVELENWSGGTQFYGPYLDAGIYAMNLIYSLHFFKVGTCPLNLYVDKEKDKLLRSLLKVPESQLFVLAIGIGEVKENFRVTLSKRKNPEFINKEF